MNTPLLNVHGLAVSFPSRKRTVTAVEDLSFSVNPGEIVALVGESGSGKSVSALSILRLIEREGGAITGGRMTFQRRAGNTVDLRQIDEPMLRTIRGDEISMIFQEPMTSLNPVLTIGDQIAEVLLLHRTMTRREALERAAEMLAKVRMPDPRRRLIQYPHELSGGMRQRVMIAMALACRPQLLIADEPTTALDVTIQAQILDLIRTLQEEAGTAVIFITHDLGVVADMADKVVVMRRGRKVEEAPTAQLFAAPQAAYTRGLLAAVPRLGSAAPKRAIWSSVERPTPAKEKPGKDDVVLKTVDLVTRFPIRKGPFRRLVANVHAVEDVSLYLRRGETLGLVGESGSGKSTIGRSIMKLVTPTAGRIAISGQDVTGLSPRAMRPFRRDVQMVFQDPYASLNPRLTILELVTEPLAIHTSLMRADRREIAAGLLTRVGMSPDALNLYPHQFSGGQRQRLCIARALSVKPKIIIADEPVSALDVSVQAQVLDLMQELQAEDGISYLFISHDLAVVEQMSHRIAVLHIGRIVETGPAAEVIGDARHAYTRRLLAAVPAADPGVRRSAMAFDVSDAPSPIRGLDYVAAPSAYDEVSTGHFVSLN